LAIKFLDLLDPLVDFLDLLLEERIALLLAGNLRVVVEVEQEPQGQPGKRGDAEHHAEFLLPLLAAFGAPREEIDPGHQSKLLRARPQALISAGASCASACAWTRGDRKSVE